MTSLNGNIFRVTGPFERNPPMTDGFPSQSPVRRSFDVLFGTCLSKQLSQQSRRRRFETPSSSLWRQCKVISAKNTSRNPKYWEVQFHTLRWRHDGHDSVSNHQPHDCLFNCLFRRRWKKTSKLRVTGLCTGNSPGTGEFPAQMASNAENVSIWWRHHE